MVYPVSFFVRRILFALSAVYFSDLLWGQLALQMTISYFMVIYLLWYKPLESPIANKIEVMNECTIIVLIYCLMCFTDFVPSPETRSKIGLWYMGISITNVSVHLIKLLL